ncbi:MAG TPA: hypothetical protein VHD88_00855 [Pyrinomonadaceae bacterium]|nr:hypothetical protein [Pyrinomonadaceae bacterium]
MEESKRRFGNGDAKVQRALRLLSKSRLTDAESLIRFHETLLFLRAYPPSAKVLKKVEESLKPFAWRVVQLRDAEADLSPLDDPEVSGIAGTTVTSNFSYEIVRWLVAKYPRQVSIDWDWFEEEDRFGSTMPRFLPLLEEDAMVEAHVPYRDCLRAAIGRGLNIGGELAWLIKRFESLNIPDKAKAALYDSLKLHVSWKFAFRASRTGMRLPVRKTFLHEKPLIQRRDVSLIEALASPPIPGERLSRVAGEKILDLARATSAVRYRELHGFTYGDARRVFKAHLGRGVDIFMMGVPPERRLPLRAYHSALIFKNRVPVAYFEGLSIFERMESGFNLYYTFREGETAWIFARVLRLMRQLLGVTVFLIDPYQIGHENEEGIESGAFWFYRKLGFRPVRPELMKLALAEEPKIALNPGYRTPARTLRKLAAGHMLFEMPNTGPANHRDWDRFEVRNLGLAVQRRMARDFNGDAARIRADSIKFVKRALDINTHRWSEAELLALDNLALALAMIPEITRWSSSDKELAARIIDAKAGRDEALYLRLMQKHSPLRASLIRLGS